MAFIQEFQLLAHSPKRLTHAQRLVAHVIAMRTLPNADSLAIPFRTLCKETNINSKSTMARALETLEALAVIRIQKQPPGSRKPSLIFWTLECPLDCQMDHARGNAKTPKTHLERELQKAKKLSPQIATHRENEDTTLRENEDALRSSNKREGAAFLEPIKTWLLGMEIRTKRHEALLNAIQDPGSQKEVISLIEEAAKKSNKDEANYLITVASNSPWKLTPKSAAIDTPQDLSNMPPEIQEAALRAEALRGKPHAA